MVSGLSSMVDYVYDDANRLTSVNGVNYTWDNNGNLLSDGVNTYTYDSANRLKTMTGPSVTASYGYNGLNDRLQEILNGQTTNFTMDLNTGLTQALSDGANTYIYGNGRIAQVNTDTEYFLGDALGSVRQLTNNSGAITYASAYDPYGVATQAYGASQTAYGYTGEYTSNDLVYLRARHYAPGMGRFLTRDTWAGDANSPITYNRWQYANANPIMYTDPSGNTAIPPLCAAALALAFGDAFLPVGDAAFLYCLLIATGVVGGGTVALYVANAPAPPGMTPVRQLPRIYTLEEILNNCWFEFRPKPQRTPEPIPSVDPPPILVTPSVSTPQPTPTKKPRKDISLGLSELGPQQPLFMFTVALNKKLNPQNIYVYSFGEWFKQGLTSESNPANFYLQFNQAAQRASQIHFNLQGINDPVAYANIGKTGFGDSSSFFTAAELYQIKENPALCQKTLFYDDGSRSLTPSQSTKMLLCGR